jgi:hypothetical protein
LGLSCGWVCAPGGIRTGGGGIQDSFCFRSQTFYLYKDL